MKKNIIIFASLDLQILNRKFASFGLRFDSISYNEEEDTVYAIPTRLAGIATYNRYKVAQILSKDFACSRVCLDGIVYPAA